MKLNNLKELIEKNTTDGNINIDTLVEEMTELTNKEINNIVAKEKNSSEKVVKDFLSENGFETVDNFKSYINDNKTKIKDYEKQINEIQSKYKNYDELQNENKTLKNKSYFIDAGIKDAKKQSYLNYLFENRENPTDEDDFAEFINKELQENEHFYKQEKVIQTSMPTGNTPTTGSKLGWESILENKKGIKLEGE
jgi:hypothetical protein